MKKILVVIGTRPEAIKLSPVIRLLKMRESTFNTIVCATAQHRQMLDQVLDFFDITPDYDLNIMAQNQDLFDITENCLRGLKGVLLNQQPDSVVVQGDTTTTFVASLAAFYLNIPIWHVEAGLRTYDKYQPFPEEKNRQMATVLADYHFAPTENARENLLKENVPPSRVWVTGNTSIDALLCCANGLRSPEKESEMIEYFRSRWGLSLPLPGRRLLLVTGHRRENFGEGIVNICAAIREVVLRNRDLHVVYPVHMNPNVRRTAFEFFGSVQCGFCNDRRIHLIDPVDYAPFVYLMQSAYIILTDSGGIQEEAPSLGKPVLVMRNTTERPEGVRAGTAKLVGTDISAIVTETQKLLDDESLYRSMSCKQNPYGDGLAAERIVQIMSSELSCPVVG